MSHKTRATYNAEFRQEVAKLVIEQGYSVREAADAMNVGKSTVDKWVRQVRQQQQDISSPLHVPIGAEQQRIRELEKEIKRVNEENEILKKASALLLSGSLKNVR